MQNSRHNLFGGHFFDIVDFMIAAPDFTGDGVKYCVLNDTIRQIFSAVLDMNSVDFSVSVAK
jgi:hypothetical protein